MTAPATLFARRDRLERELRQVNAAIDASRRQWADAQGFRVVPRTEAFRLAVGA